MITKIHKWGNSLAIRIPKAFAKNTDIENGSLVAISVLEDQIVIKPVREPEWTLDKLLEGVNENNIHSETETGKRVGNETW